MNKFFIVCCCFFFFSAGICNEPKFHICTVATQKTKGLEQLLDSCKQFNINIDVLGMGSVYRGLSDKIIHLREYIKDLPDDDIFMFVDGYDVLCLADEKTILDKFFSIGAPFIIAVERGCGPYPILIRKYPHSSTSFRYLNSGTYIGYVSVVKKILNEFGKINPKLDDQGYFALHYFENPDLYTFDYYCELFFPILGVDESEMVFDIENKSVTVLETGTTPCFFHGNGKAGRILYQKCYDLFFGAKK